LKAIICIGETESQRDAGDAHAICQSQLEASVPDGATPANTVLAYEPVLGHRHRPDTDVGRDHGDARSYPQLSFAPAGPKCERRCGADSDPLWRLGKPDNANEILNLPEVSGALVGGASLKASDFSALSAQ